MVCSPATPITGASYLQPWLAGPSVCSRLDTCLIDGEVVVCNEQGRAVFNLLRRGERVKHEAHLMHIDLLELDGRNPISTRHRMCKSLSESTLVSWRLTDSLPVAWIQGESPRSAGHTIKGARM